MVTEGARCALRRRMKETELKNKARHQADERWVLMSFQDSNPGGVRWLRSEPELTPAARTDAASPSASRRAGGHQLLKSSCSTFLLFFTTLEDLNKFLSLPRKTLAASQNKEAESPAGAPQHAVCFVLFLPSRRLVWAREHADVSPDTPAFSPAVDERRGGSFQL